MSVKRRKPVPSPAGSDIESIDLDLRLRSLVHALRRRFGKPIGEGRHRIVFATKSGRFVVKVPTRESGCDANLVEAPVANRCRNPRLAKCRLLTVDGVPLLVMERVDEETAHADRASWPDWAWSIDSGQIGYDRRRCLVAFDWESC